MAKKKKDEPEFAVLITLGPEGAPGAEVLGQEFDQADLGSAQLQSGIIKTMLGGREEKADFGKMKESWLKINQQAKALLESGQGSAPKGFSLEKISFSFGLSGKGSFGFVSAGANASISMTFNRKKR